MLQYQPKSHCQQHCRSDITLGYPAANTSSAITIIAHCFLACIYADLSDPGLAVWLLHMPSGHIKWITWFLSTPLTVVKAACGILFLALVVKVRECQEQTHPYQDFTTLHCACIHTTTKYLLLCHQFGRVTHLGSSVLLNWPCNFYHMKIIIQTIKNLVQGDENQVICFVWPYLCKHH